MGFKKKLSTRQDIVIRTVDKGGAVIILDSEQIVIRRTPTI